MKHSKQALSLLLLSAILTVSCGGGSTAADTQTSDTDTTTAAPETTAGYDYPDVDMGGQTFKILTADDYWGMNVEVDVEEQNGEPLNDAIFKRNAAVEEALNCVIEDTNLGISNVISNVTAAARKEILSGDCIHDVMYVTSDQLFSMANENMLMNLADLDALSLDEPWWDSVYNEMATFNGKIWGASGDAFLMPYDCQWAMFFNEDILEANKLDMPYDLVREGKWTIDKLHEYCTAVANLNGDESFAWKDGGAALYGLVSHTHAPDKFIFSADNNYVTKKGNELTFTADTERYYNTIEKIAALLGEEGTHLAGNSNDFDTDRGYVYTFLNNRAVFLTAELKTANNIRDMEATFGIVPFPKFDEAQENYRTNLMIELMVMTIPAISKNAENAAILMDALAYESSQTVVPTYFDVIVSQKGLRNEDSIEMMEIMKETRGVDIAVVYGWNSALKDTIRTKTMAGNASVASDIAKGKTAIETSMKKFVDLMGLS